MKVKSTMKTTINATFSTTMEIGRRLKLQNEVLWTQEWEQLEFKAMLGRR